jgi:ABC-type nickel/cobalt efflux system permease component RcnA
MEASPIAGLFVICTAMFAGAFVAGMSCYKLNRRQLAWLNCFAAGLLLGTALGVIIPEGVRSIYEGAKTAHPPHAKLDVDADHHEPEHVVELNHAGEEAHHGHDHEENHQERLLGEC